MPSTIPPTSSIYRRARARRSAMTLVETIVALAMLVVCGVAGVYSFMLLNRYAMRERNISSAKALCQERIEQALTTLYSPPGTLPAVLGNDPANPGGTKLYNILGTAANYSSSGIYSGAESFSEPVTIYVQQDGTTASAVTGTRTTTVTPAGIADSSGTSVTLPIVQFAVTVTYNYQGENRTYSMYTMRGSN